MRRPALRVGLGDLGGGVDQTEHVNTGCNDVRLGNTGDDTAAGERRDGGTALARGVCTDSQRLRVKTRVPDLACLVAGRGHYNNTSGTHVLDSSRQRVGAVRRSSGAVDREREVDHLDRPGVCSYPVETGEDLGKT